MTPEEMMQTIEELRADVLELKEWKAARMRQQLTNPVDLISKRVLGAILGGGLGSRTTTRTVGAVPATFVKLFTGTVLLDTPNGIFEVPYY